MPDHFPTQLAPLATLLRQGELSLTVYLDQLEAHFNNLEPQLHTFLPETGRFERLRQEAVALEARYPDPLSRPPLYGIPIGVKDIFHADGFLTQAGSRVPADLLAGPEAKTVSQLKQAGALLMGKTVTTEFAYFGPGPTRNPHNPDHTPGGSSSGSAAAVGAGLCPLTLGTQTVGSIVRPAAFCGIVGYKPSYGRTSAEGVIPLAPSVDHIGYFTQGVAGIEWVAPILCDNWSNDAKTETAPVIGIPDGPYLEHTSPEGLSHFQATCDKLRQAGFEIRTVAAMPDFVEIYNRHNTLVAAEAALVHKVWFADFSGLYHQKTFDLIQQGQTVATEQLEACRAGRQQLRQELTGLMAGHNLSLWLSPSAVGPAPATLESTGDPVMNLPWTHAGLPALNLPASRMENGLPLGIQLVAGWQQDEQLLGWAKQIEAALAWQ